MVFDEEVPYRMEVFGSMLKNSLISRKLTYTTKELYSKNTPVNVKEGLKSNKTSSNSPWDHELFYFIHNGIKFNLLVRYNLLPKNTALPIRLNKQGIWVFDKAGYGEVNDFHPLESAICSSLGILDYFNSKKMISYSGAYLDSIAPQIIREIDSARWWSLIAKQLAVSEKALFDYCDSKEIFYVQLGDGGFYSLSSDPAGLGAPKFSATFGLKINLFLDLGDSEVQEGIYAKLILKKSPLKSRMSLIKNSSQKLPPIRP